ncbi:hypothetical protein CHLNCDRAFT_31972 [Chlorella variabilis]|uniref:Adaptor protein ClpS core domain-containing protein n=1 Tax=Chlorella variabilis TaxID=554065 RepID=E1ZJ89_CHLVA|nr:hypothetical protein CHLNCDRAFT_31972 [Chlorella variabilis]EFN54094.1 hypothetical protein CHLNCDRAFT_31972 [Chlorella variabilis]|eukprot:XP_005846196.1 hypothetical protein CHLNCDRAFT_31972 [Chlorella variabilis]
MTICVGQRLGGQAVAGKAGDKPPTRGAWLVPAGATRRSAQRRARLHVAARSAGKGGGVLDRPGVLPGQQRGRETRRRRPPSYRVLLHNDNYNRREYVVQVLMKVVEGTTVDDAVNIMQEAHINGLAMVTQCAQDKAELYCESLRLNGLIATIEPAGTGGSDGTSSS